MKGAPGLRLPRAGRSLTRALRRVQALRGRLLLARHLHPAGWFHDDPKEQYPSQFEIHMGRCIVCGFCAEACPEDATEMSYDFELATPSLDSLIYRKESLVQEPLEREKR